jgi:hypothetical protein
MEIIEGLCYTHPHFPELVATSPVMRGVWRKCVSLLTHGAVMAPLFVDDRPQVGEICVQTVEELIFTTTGRNYQSFSWLGTQISEAELQDRHGALGCVKLDVLYHLHVLWSLAIVDPGWKWIVVHPFSFQTQQARMLEELWRRLAMATSLDVMAGSVKQSRDEFRAQARDKFLRRFTHYWVDESGHTTMVTQPAWRGKKIIHETV